MAPGKREYHVNIFLICLKKYIVWELNKSLIEGLKMSPHKICFHGEIRKKLCDTALLFEAVASVMFLLHCIVIMGLNFMCSCLVMVFSHIFCTIILMGNVGLEVSI